MEKDIKKKKTISLHKIFQDFLVTYGDEYAVKMRHY
jgi:hypothetical protein